MRASDLARIATAAVAAVAILAGFGAASCGGDSARPTKPSAGPATEDSAGARRIAVMAPAAAETLGALGVADRIVAVGDFVEPPAGAPADLPKLGAYDLPNGERLVELRVDLLVTTASEAARGEHERLRAAGVDVLALDTSTFAGALAAIGELGERVGKGEEARHLVAAIESDVARVRERVAGASRPRVLVAVGHDPLYVAGPGSHLDELVTIAGGTNVAGGVAGAYATLALEAVLERRPEVILDSADNRTSGPWGAVSGSWSRWPFLPAVANRRVYALEPSRLLVPGPRLGEMAERMGRLVHPELFGAPVADDFAPAGANVVAIATPEAPNTAPVAPRRPRVVSGGCGP